MLIHVPVVSELPVAPDVGPCPSKIPDQPLGQLIGDVMKNSPASRRTRCIPFALAAVKASLIPFVVVEAVSGPKSAPLLGIRPFAEPTGETVRYSSYVTVEPHSSGSPFGLYTYGLPQVGLPPRAWRGCVCEWLTRKCSISELQAKSMS
jgi:hypothetical protein